MTPSDKLREFTVNHGHREYFKDGDMDGFITDQRFLSELNALISEDYVERAKYDKLLQQRDELLIALIDIRNKLYITEKNGNVCFEIAEAAIKSTDTCSEKPNNSQKTEGGEGCR